MFDGDEAGTRATLRAIPVLTKEGIKVRTLDVASVGAEKVSDGGVAKDPDEYLQKHGAASLAELIGQAPSHIMFQVEIFKKKHDMTTTEGRVGFTQEAAALLATLTSDIEIAAYVSEISKVGDISESAIFAEINKQRGTAVVVSPVVRKKMTTGGQGAKKAKEALLHLVLTYHTAAAALEKSEYIGVEEMGGGVYAELLKLAFSNAREGKKMSVAEIVTRFDSVEHITGIFVDAPEYATKAAVEKALNETAFIIKRAWVLNEMESENAKNNPQTLQLLGSMLRNEPSILL